MGKGVSLMFRKSFPRSAGAYQAAPKAGNVLVGRVFVTESESLISPKTSCIFPRRSIGGIHPGSNGFAAACATW